MIPLPQGERVEVLRPGSDVDRYGDTLVDWSTVSAASVLTGCAVAPATSAENNDGRSAVVDVVDVYAAVGADVLPSDRLVIRGLVYEVVGSPEVWRSPFSGWEAGVKITARKVDG